ncbi:MAG: hypothetical protein HZB26_15965 [Candidatus Hydrogenedentes bacterium]|nr:hypothetical protein [Candidatus Hydrogenedentota bacterium]
MCRKLETSGISVKKILIGAALIAWLAMGSAQAVMVDYTVSGSTPQFYPGPYTAPDGAPHLVDGLGYPGDSVGLGGYSSGALDLAPGSSTVQQINTLLWTVSYTYAGTDNDWTNDATGDWVQLNLPTSLTSTISFAGGTTGALSQTGLLEVNWDNDYLQLYDGPVSSFVVNGYQIDVTPFAVARTGATNFSGFPGGTPWTQPSLTMYAHFDVSAAPVPEPVTMIMLGCMGAGMLGSRMIRRKKS